LYLDNLLSGFQALIPREQNKNTNRKLREDNLDQWRPSGKFTERCNLESILRKLSSFSCGRCSKPVQRTICEGNKVLTCNRWIAIVQQAGSSSAFDDHDAALQSGSSEKRVAMLRQVADLFLSEADHN
jgi:hypothetical protein